MDYQNRFYAGELLDSIIKVDDIAELTEDTAPNAVDYWNGEYAGAVSDSR